MSLITLMLSPISQSHNVNGINNNSTAGLLVHLITSKRDGTKIVGHEKWNFSLSPLQHNLDL
jgi:hypothetical protein